MLPPDPRGVGVTGSRVPSFGFLKADAVEAPDPEMDLSVGGG